MGLGANLTDEAGQRCVRLLFRKVPRGLKYVLAEVAQGLLDNVHLAKSSIPLGISEF